MKKYILKLPEKFKNKDKKIKEYLVSELYRDGILTSGACAKLLKIWKYEFQTEILSKYNIKFDG